MQHLHETTVRARKTARRKIVLGVLILLIGLTASITLAVLSMSEGIVVVCGLLALYGSYTASLGAVQLRDIDNPYPI